MVLYSWESFHSMSQGSVTRYPDFHFLLPHPHPLFILIRTVSRHPICRIGKQRSHIALYDMGNYHLNAIAYRLSTTQHSRPSVALSNQGYSILLCPEEYHPVSRASFSCRDSYPPHRLMVIPFPASITGSRS